MFCASVSNAGITEPNDPLSEMEQWRLKNRIIFHHLVDRVRSIRGKGQA
jgi:hypothetical protein